VKKSEATAARQLFGDASQLPARADPVVELRSVLNECKKILDCHHRATHKPLRERVAKCLERIKP
jgi:hypothetical protein